MGNINIKAEKGSHIQVTDKPIVNVLGDLVNQKSVNVINGKVQNEQRESDVLQHGMPDVKTVLEELLTATKNWNGKSVPLMREQEQWYAVYRVLNEIKRFPSKMTDFNESMKDLGMDTVNPPCVYESLKAASKKVPLLSCSVLLWQKYKDVSEVYTKQCDVAASLLNKMGYKA